jgi:hypothetical protein
MGLPIQPADSSSNSDRYFDKVLLVTRGGPFFIHPENDARRGISIDTLEEVDYPLRPMGGYDLFILPSGLFIALSPGRRPWPAIAYGEGLDAASAFEAGALDYMRNRWPAEELYARAARLMRPKFSFRDAGAVMEGRTLALTQPGAALPRCLSLSPGDSRILRILAAAKGNMVPRHALMGEGLSQKALSMRISRLRKTLNEFSPGLGECIAGADGGYVFLP